MSVRSTESREVRNAAARVGLVAAGLVLLVGCAGRKVDLRPVMPVRPARDPRQAARWYHQWEHQPDLISEDIRRMELILSVLGRRRRARGERVVYSARAILVDEQGTPAKEVQGCLQAFLVEYPDDPDRYKAVKAWELDVAETHRRFVRVPMSGYALQLDWGDGPPPRPVQHMLVIRWVSKDGRSRFTRNVRFDEGITYEISTTTRPVGAGGRGGSGGSSGGPVGGAGAGGG